MPALGPIFKGVLKGTVEALEAAKKPQIEMPAKPVVVERAPGAAFPGPAPIREAVRATENKAPATTTEKIMGLRRLAESFVRPDPGVSKAVEETMFKGRSGSRAAHEIAKEDIGQWYAPLLRDPVNQSTLVNDYMTTADEVAQAVRYGKDRIRDIHIDLWKDTLNKLQSAVDADPEVQTVLQNIRSGLDEQFNDLVARNWIAKDRYLNDYTPIRRINATVEALANYMGDDAQALKDRLLPAQMQRQGGGRPRETDLPQLLLATRREYLAKVAEHEAFLDLLADPNVNLTEKFLDGEGRLVEDLPSNVRLVRPVPGKFGATLKGPEGYFLQGGLNALDPKGKINVHGYVMPMAVADAVDHFHPRTLKGEENKLYRMGLGLMKNLTIYNPKNTNVNRAGDLATALLFPGEGKAHAIGVLRWMGTANQAAYKGAFDRGGRERRVRITLHGRTVDLWEEAVRQGMTSGTIAEQLAGSTQSLPPDLARLYPQVAENHANYWAKTKHTLEADRLATEVAPRIAAGLEAVERTGDWSQFGRVGRDITFRYGAGAPRAASFPIVKVLDPFIQYMGLATARFLEMAGSKQAGPKARILLGLTAVPAAMWMWNTQNDSYKQIENALAPEERNLPHIILGSLENPGEPQRDVEGNPVVLRFKYFVPEQVTQMIGLANAPERVGRVLSGRDTPVKFVQDTGAQAKKSMGDMLVLPTMLKELATQKSELTGKPLEGVDLLNRAVPGTRIISKALERGAAYGPAEGAKTVLTEASGASFAKPKHKGAALLDADMQKAQMAVNDARRSLRWSMRNGSPAQVSAAKKKLTEAAAEVQRLAKQLKAEKAAGYKPPKPDVEANRARIEANRKALTEGQ
jgi:hypothetical protein